MPSKSVRVRTVPKLSQVQFVTNSNNFGFVINSMMGRYLAGVVILKRVKVNVGLDIGKLIDGYEGNT